MLGIQEVNHVGIRVREKTRSVSLLADIGIEITGQFSFGGMSAVFIRDPDRNVIELDQFTNQAGDDTGDYSSHL